MTRAPFAGPGLESVRVAFDAVLRDSPETGAAFAAVRDGDVVVDVWGGIADPASGRGWAADTIVPILSCTKALTASCLLLLEDRGAVDLDAPIGGYWPEFAAQAKDDVRVVDVLTHRAGVPGITPTTTWADVLDSRVMADRTAAQSPLVPSGEMTYHLATFGWICGELVRRVDGRSIGRFFADEIAGPLGLDAWIGLPAASERMPGTIRLGSGWGDANPFLVGSTDDPRIRAIWANPPMFARSPVMWNERHVLAAEIPALGGVASALSMAALFDAILAGRPPFRRGLASRILGARVASRDVLLGGDRAYGLGFELQTSARHLGPDVDAFGHTGAGGAILGAWPSTGVAFAFVPNELRDVDRDDRRDSLLHALADVLLLPE